MKRKSIVLSCLLTLVVAAFFTGCAGMQKASETNFETPTVALSHVELELVDIKDDEQRPEMLFCAVEAVFVGLAEQYAV